MKKIVAILLAITAVFSLVVSGCRETETEQPKAETTAETTATTETTLPTEELTISWELARTLRAKKLVADKEDFSDFEHMVRRFLLSLHGDYDSSSPDAFKNAMYMLFNSGVNMCSEMYGKDPNAERFGEYDEEAGRFVFEPDPLNRFSDIEEVAGYKKVDAEYVDWVLENVFCVTPDHTKTSKDFDYSAYPNYEEYYYYNGYYYASLHEGGGGGGPVKTIGYIYNRDGSYTVRFTTFEDKDLGLDSSDMLYYSGYDIIEATASLEEVDGQRVWAMSEVKILERFDQE